MSRNPYLAASRPTSSFTRSSRSSKRNDLSSGKSSLIGRSRSSANLGGYMASTYTTSNYTPSASSTWQRPLSSSRISRPATDPSTSSASSSRANAYTPSPQLRNTEPSEEPRSSLNRSASTQSLTQAGREDDDGDAFETSNHLRNYQQSKIQQQQDQQLSAKTKSTVQSLNSDTSQSTKRSTTSLNSSSIANSLTGLDNVEHDDVSNPNEKALSKSRSLDIGQHLTDVPSTITSSMSVDTLLTKCESMSEKELRKSYRELVVEYERLKKHLQDVDDREKNRQQEWIRKERQMQRKISELEEENKHMDEWRQEIQRLKDENRSLIRVVSKLTKQH